jgi:hypothetical protein
MLAGKTKVVGAWTLSESYLRRQHYGLPFVLDEFPDNLF